jgi:signal transduction histidine kinase
MRVGVWPLWPSLQSACHNRTLSQGLAVIALLALGRSLLISPGWAAVDSAIHTPVFQIGLVALLLAALARSGEGSAIVRRAEHEREEERARLTRQIEQLKRQIDESQRRLVEIHDQVLKRVGVELHDGPAQLISFALLRLDGLQQQDAAGDGNTSPSDLERIRSALKEALAEVRCMAAGLILPELSLVQPADVLRLAVRNHERRTGTSVVCEMEGLPEQLTAAVKSCLYRFVQEALNNAYCHAAGRGQTVRALYRRGILEVKVADAGPGFDPDSKIGGGRLGLLGMRERVTLLGGTFEIESQPGLGTQLTTRFKLAGTGSHG